MKEPIKYPSENRLTLLVPAKNTMANVNQMNPMRTIRFSMSSHDLNKINISITIILFVHFAKLTLYEKRNRALDL